MRIQSRIQLLPFCVYGSKRAQPGSAKNRKYVHIKFINKYFVIQNLGADPDPDPKHWFRVHSITLTREHSALYRVEQAGENPKKILLAVIYCIWDLFVQINKQRDVREGMPTF
jgi:hypothetical protein